MRQTRLSIGCQDWQEIVRTIGAEAAGVLIYLRTVMRGMQTAEISITISELAEAVRVTPEAAERALAAICTRYLERADAGAIITLRSPEEGKALAERERKRTATAAKKIATKCHKLSAGNSGEDSEIPKNELKTYHTDFFMCYRGNSETREKEPHTPQKEESLTEIQTRTRSNKTCEQPELPADSLESEYIDVCGSWPASLRKAVRNEAEDVREAFYLYLRKRQTEGGRTWSSDEVRIALLAAKRVPKERRAESILAASMGGWKTIRDAGSGCYFEKETGRVVSLVRGTVERGPCSATQRENADLAVELARKMRRD